MNILQKRRVWSEKRRHSRVNNAIDAKAKGAASFLQVKAGQDSSEQPPLRFNAGVSPRGVEDHVFMQHAGELAVTLVRGNLETDIVYDHAASIEATAEVQQKVEAVRTVTSLALRPAAILVFNRAEV